MLRTTISLSGEDKMWLDRPARAEQVSMTELVRRAVREYRERYHDSGANRLQELLGRTRGCWTHGDGLRYQDAARHNMLDLVTRNTRDFPPERYAFVKVPYAIEPSGTAPRSKNEEVRGDGQGVEGASTLSGEPPEPPEPREPRELREPREPPR